MSALTNRPTLESIRTLPIGEIAALPADLLVLLQEDAEAALAAAKTTAEWIAGAIALRYADRAQAARRAENKDTGTVRFEDGSVTVICRTAKACGLGPARAGCCGRAHPRRWRRPGRIH